MRPKCPIPILTTLTFDRRIHKSLENSTPYSKQYYYIEYSQPHPRFFLPSFLLHHKYSRRFSFWWLKCGGGIKMEEENLIYQMNWGKCNIGKILAISFHLRTSNWWRYLSMNYIWNINWGFPFLNSYIII